MKRLYIDYESCIGCDLCAMSCSLEKSGRINPAQSRSQLIKIEHEGSIMPAVCRHCEVPPCIPACPVDVITQDETTELVSIYTANCIGCKLCIEACPYAGPVQRPVTEGKVSNIKVICDLCRGNPVCAQICPTGTLQYITVDTTRNAQQHQGEQRLAELLSSLE